MTETAVERLEGWARNSLEVSFCLEIRGCPNCREREIGRVSSNHYQDLETGQSAGSYDLVCPRCGLARRIEFFTAPEFHQLGKLGFDKPVTLGGPNPSTMIEPHEFVHELHYDFAELDKAFAMVPAMTGWGRLLQNAELCIQELPKFLPDSADAIPESHFRTDAAKAVRSAHPAWFRRSYVEEQQRRVEEYIALADREVARRDAAGEKSAPLPPLVSAFSDASFALHRAWLADKGGQRLQVKGGDATGKRISALDLSAAVLEDVTLDRADLSFTRFHGATFTDVRARGAGFASAMIAGTKLVRCDFSLAGMPIAKLGDSTIEACTFAGANLERTTWYRAKVTNTSFADCVMQDVGIDKAEFTDCDFRGADLSAPKELPGTSMDAVFIRCDLRDTNWQGRELFRVRFVDCKFSGARGTPRPERTVIERPDLSAAGDGSNIGTARDVLVAWGIDPDAPPPKPPEPTHRELVYDLSDDEGDHLEALLRLKRMTVTKRLFHHGAELRFELRVQDPIAASVAAEIEAELARYREVRQRRQTELRREVDPLSSPLARQRIVEEVLDDAADRGDSFEATVQRLVDLGFTVEQAHEAIIDPSTGGRAK